MRIDHDWGRSSRELIEAGGPELLREAFRAPMTGTLSSTTTDVSAYVGVGAPHGSGQASDDGAWYACGFKTGHGGSGTLRGQLTDALGSDIAEHLLWRAHRPPYGAGSLRDSLRRYAPGQGLYLPASRTGYVHVLPDVVSDVFARLGTESEPLADVPAPVLQFFAFLATGRPRREPVASDLARLLESRALGGGIEREDRGVGRFAYRPKHADVSVPLARSSAVVSELAPLVTLLRESDSLPSLLVYEEPEAHLHPRLQRIVAQVLVRMVNRGCRVLVTTHSDTFAQQINNHLKLGAARDLEAALAALRARSGDDRYTAEDALTPDQVSAYEFTFRPDGRSVAEALVVRPDGVVMPSFNRELAELTDEVLLLDELALDAG